jgi:transposase
MARNELPDELLELILRELPPLPKIGPTGGRPPIEHPVVVKVVWHVLVTGCRWCDVPKSMDCCGETARTRVCDWQILGVWDRVHRLLLIELRKADKLDPEVAIVDSTQTRAFGGGELTGPNPVDRAKPGTKHTLVVDKNGVPLQVKTVGSNVSDHHELLPLIVEFPCIAGKVGRPKELPDVVIADAGYDSEAARAILRWLNIEPLIRKRGAAHGSHLGRIRWVVERTISWFKGYRRLRFRYDRKQEMIQAWAKLAAVAICFNMLNN